MGILEFIVIILVLCFVTGIGIHIFEPPALAAKIIWAAVFIVCLVLFLRAIGFHDPAIPKL